MSDAAFPARPRRLAALLAWVGLSLAAGVVGGGAVGPGAWYARLDRPPWTPPDWVFGPVWTALYVLMGVAAWMVWSRPDRPGRRTALVLFLGQLVLNVLWSWMFFGWHRLGAAAVEVVVLLAAIAATALAFRRVHRPAALLLVPYLVWVAYATALTIEIWRRNA